MNVQNQSSEGVLKKVQYWAKYIRIFQVLVKLQFIANETKLHVTINGVYKLSLELASDVSLNILEI